MAKLAEPPSDAAGPTDDDAAPPPPPPVSDDDAACCARVLRAIAAAPDAFKTPPFRDLRAAVRGARDALAASDFGGEDGLARAARAVAATRDATVARESERRRFGAKDGAADRTGADEPASSTGAAATRHRR